MKAKAFFLISLALLSGLGLSCSYAQTIETKDFKGSKEYKELDQKGAPTCTISFDLTLPVSGLNPTAKAKVMPVLLEHSLGKKYAYRQDIDFAIKQCLDETYQDMKNDVDMTEIDAEWPAAYSMDNYIQYDGIQKNIIHFTSSTSMYMGGAHPMTVSESLNFDVNSGKRVTLKDILKEGCGIELTSLIKEDLTKQEVEYWETEEFTLENFIIEEGGICFWFNAYDVAPYVYGAPSVTISWEQLKPFLKIKF